MSHDVRPEDLSTTAAPYGHTPFLLYAGDDGSARVNHVVARFGAGDENDADEDDRADRSSGATVFCTGFGRGVARRVEAGAQLSLLWPAPSEDMFSLIADGTGIIADDVLAIRVTEAVLHRPAPVDGDARC